MFTFIAWYIVVLSFLCTLVTVSQQCKTAKETKMTIIGIIFQCIPMFLLAGHSLGWF